MNQLQKAVLSRLSKVNPAPQTILDIGCGDGSFTQLLAYYFSRANITALDVVSPQQSFESGRVRFVKGSVEQMPFDPDLFDAAIACMSLHHWDDKQQGIHEAFRVLKAGGNLIIGDPLRQGWMDNKLMAWLLKVIDSGTIATEDELVDYAKQAGFKPPQISLVAQSIRSLFVITAEKPHA